MSQWLASDRTSRRGNDRHGSEMSSLLKPDLAPTPQQQQQQQQQHFQQQPHPPPPSDQGYAQRPPRKGSAGAYGSQLPTMPHPLLFHNGSYPPVVPFQHQTQQQHQPQYQQPHHAPASGHPHSPSGAQRRVPQPPSSNGIPPQSSRSSVPISSFQFGGSFQQQQPPSYNSHINPPPQQQQQSPYDGPGPLDYGRKTPDPPKGSYRLHPHEVVHTHPPSAPPAQREKQRTNRGGHVVAPVPMQMLFDPKAPPSLGGVQGFNPSYNSDQRPPMHGNPPRQQGGHPSSSAFDMTNQYNNGPAPAAPRGSVQSTLASARGYSKLTVSQPQTQHALAVHSARLASNNSPSPNSTPVKPRNGFSAMQRGANGGGNTYTSEGFSIGGGSLSANASPFPSPRGVVPPPSFVEQRRRATAAPIPIALSWPNDNNNGPSSSNNGSVTARGSVLRNSHPSSLNGNGGNHGAPNFPSIMKRGAQLIEASPPVLTPEAGPRDSPPDVVDTDFEPLASDEDNWEDVALVDFAEEEEHVRRNGGGRVGSGARRKREAAGVKKLDLSGAQSFRAPYHRKQFASKETNGGGGKTSRKAAAGLDDVLPAAEWDSKDGAHSDDEHGGDHKPQESKQQHDYEGNDGNQPSNGGWILDVGMAENANPRFRASMEDAYVIRRKFGPAFPVTTRKNSGSSKEGADGENKESQPPAANDDVEQVQGSFFAIYDGHGGRTCVDFISRHFHREFARKLQRGSSDVPRAFEVAAQRVDAAMAPMTHIGIMNDEYQECGSTACMAYLRPCGPRNQNRELFMANIGDAQAVLAFDKSALTGSKKGGNENGDAATDRNGSASQKKRRNHGGSIVGLNSNALATGLDSTRTPKKGKNPNSVPLTGAAAAVAAIAPTNSSSLAKTIARSGSGKPSERESGAAADQRKKLSAIPLSYAHVATDAKEMARIKAAGGCVFANRVNGCLAVSRAFGDHSLKTAGVSCQPYQQYVELTSAHKYLIIGCDGVWDVLSFKQAVAAVAGMTNAQAMAQKLVDLAIKKGTTDNVSCMVVRFRQ